MQFNIIIVKYAELSLKKRNRSIFSKKLFDNINLSLKNISNIKIVYFYDYIEIIFDQKHFLEKNYTSVINILKNTPGVSSIFPSIKSKLDEKIVLNNVIEIINYYKVTNFKIDVKRYDKSFKYNSSEFKQIIGTNLPTDIKKNTNFINPENIIMIFIYKDICYICLNKYLSLKGLPLGSSGKALVLISGGIDSPVASYSLIKKGIELEYIHFTTPPHSVDQSIDKVRKIIKELNAFTSKPQKLHIIDFSKIQNEIMCSVKPSYRIIVMRRFFYMLAAEFAKLNKFKAIGTGESLGQVASQTISSLLATEEAVSEILFLRPLIGLNKDEIIDIAKKINTYQISIEPYSDCCELFVPKYPTTNPLIKFAKFYQNKVLVDKLSKYIENNIKTEIIK